jgi:hypothetical protein
MRRRAGDRRQEGGGGGGGSRREGVVHGTSGKSEPSSVLVPSSTSTPGASWPDSSAAIAGRGKISPSKTGAKRVEVRPSPCGSEVGRGQRSYMHALPLPTHALPTLPAAGSARACSAAVTVVGIARADQGERVLARHALYPCRGLPRRPPSISRDKNRGDLRKFQSKWTASEMETPGARARRRGHSPGLWRADRRSRRRPPSTCSSSC